MTLTLGLPGIIAVVSISLLVLLAVKLVLQRSADTMAKSLMLLLLAGLMALVANQMYGAENLALRFPHYSFSTVGLMYSIGPVLYTYVRRVADGRSVFVGRWWYLHWLPALILWLVFVPYYSQSAAEKIAFLPTLKATLWVTLLYLFNYTQIIIYCCCCFPPLRRYHRMLQNNVADTHWLNLRWLQYLCVGFLLLVPVDVVLPLLGIAGPALYNSVLVLVSLLLIVLCYSALGQSRFPFSEFVLETESPTEAEADRYAHSSLREDSARHYLAKLEALMREERAYRDGELSLRRLAERLRMSPHHLSQLLNEQLQQRFYDYINTWRIDDAKQQLVEEPEKTITDIAFAVGYNNKASFYNAFKRQLGLTPSQYRQRSIAAVNEL